MRYLKPTIFSRFLLILPAAFLVVFSAQAFAQVGPTPVSAPVDESAPAADADASATASSSTPVEAAPVVKKRSKDESIYVLLVRSYSKRG